MAPGCTPRWPRAGSWSASSTARPAAPGRDPTRSTRSAPPATPWPALTFNQPRTGAERAALQVLLRPGRRDRRGHPGRQPAPGAYRHRSRQVRARFRSQGTIAIISTALRLRPTRTVGIEAATATFKAMPARFGPYDSRPPSTRKPSSPRRVLAPGPAHHPRGRPDRGRGRAHRLVRPGALRDDGGSRCSPEPPPSRRPRARPCATGSTASATGNSTGPSCRRAILGLGPRQGSTDLAKK